MADRCEAIIISLEEPATVEDLFIRRAPGGADHYVTRKRERERGKDLCA